MRPTDAWIEGKRLQREFEDRFGPRISCRKLNPQPKRAAPHYLQLQFWEGTPHLFARYLVPTR